MKSKITNRRYQVDQITYSNNVGTLTAYMCVGTRRDVGIIEKLVTRSACNKWIAPSKYHGIFFVDLSDQVPQSIITSIENVVVSFHHNTSCKIQGCCNIQDGALCDNSKRLPAVNYYHKALYLECCSSPDCFTLCDNHGNQNLLNRGGSRTVTTCKMESFVIIVNGWKPLIIMTKCSILDVAVILVYLIAGLGALAELH